MLQNQGAATTGKGREGRGEGKRGWGWRDADRVELGVGLLFSLDAAVAVEQVDLPAGRTREARMGAEREYCDRLHRASKVEHPPFIRILMRDAHIPSPHGLPTFPRALRGCAARLT